MSSAALLFAAFAGAALIKAIRDDAGCDCFGDLIAVSPRATVFVDFVIVGAIVVVEYLHSVRCTLYSSRVVCLRVAAIIAAFVASCLYFTVNSERAVVVDMRVAEHWKGRPFPISVTSLPSAVMSGTWRIVIYRPSCKRCEVVLAECESQGANGLVLSHALAALSVEANESGMRPWGDAAGAVRDDVQWMCQTPTIVVIENGIIVRILQP
jgi:hypothetical protein